MVKEYMMSKPNYSKKEKITYLKSSHGGGTRENVKKSN
jgi:hypothetical protein